MAHGRYGPATARAILERSARRLAAPPEEHDEGALVWLAEFTVAGFAHAIRLTDLLGTVPIQQARGLPLSSPEVIGVLRWQDAVITAFSLGALLGVRGWQVDPRVLLVVGTASGRVYAIDCEAIPRAVQVPETVLASAEAWDAERGIFELTEETRSVRLLDVERLVPRR